MKNEKFAKMRTSRMKFLETDEGGRHAEEKCNKNAHGLVYVEKM